MQAITLYKNKNACHCCNYINKYGFSKDLTFEEIMNIAIQNRATGIQRSSPNSKWYLRDKPIDVLISRMKDDARPYSEFYIIHY